MKKISIVTGCYNEESNIRNWYNQVIKQINKYKDYDYEIIVIDNCSEDNSLEILRELAKENPKLKIIVNAKNFGVARSPFYAMQQATGDAMIYLASDLQDPPVYIPKFIKKWEEGNKIVIGEKLASKESKIKWFLRQCFYNFIKLIEDSDSTVLSNFTGYGIYDKDIVKLMREYDNPYPYIKNFVAEIGFSPVKIPFKQAERKAGRTKHSFSILLDCLFSVLTNTSSFPIKFMIICGFVLSFFSFLTGLIYFVYKLIHWNSFQLGIAPLVIGTFMILSFQTLFIGLIGEYILSIYKRVDKKPLVIEKERINF